MTAAHMRAIADAAAAETLAEVGSGGVRQALLSVLMDEYGGTEEDWTAMRSLCRVINVIKALATDGLLANAVEVERCVNNWDCFPLRNKAHVPSCPMMRPVTDCGHVDAEDGCCTHPGTTSAECHMGVRCPVLDP